MHFTSALAVAASLATIVTAAPTAEAQDNTPKVPKPRLKFTVKQKTIGKFQRTWPGVSMLNTYRKYNKAAPSSIKEAAASGQAGSVANVPLPYDEVMTI